MSTSIILGSGIPEPIQSKMRQFVDHQGKRWMASVSRADGPDYKGRFFMVLENDSGLRISLADIRWNTEKTARRTLQTMSDVELRRRLRSATGRSAVQGIS
mgnify:CR=1 FL=1